MPATSKAQQHFFGMIEAGKRPRPKGMSAAQVKHFASTKTKGLPYRAKSSNDKHRKTIAAIRARHGGKS